MERYPRETVEYVYVAVDTTADLDTLTVEMQILAYGVRPTPTGWKAATWGVDGNGKPAAQILIGPGTDFDFSTSPGTVIPWAKVTAPPEAPLLEGNPIEIT